MKRVKNKHGVLVPICPECINHVQGETEDVLDCKNTFGIIEYEEGKYSVEGQCNCWSEEHGKRYD